MLWLAASITALLTPRLSADITLVSRLSDARASAATMFNGSSNPPAQIQTDFMPANLSNSAMVSGESGAGNGNCTSNSGIVVDNQMGTLQITGDGQANAGGVLMGGSGSGTAKLIVISFTLTNDSYSYSITGQLSAQQFILGGSSTSAAKANLAGTGGTIFNVVADHPPALALSQAGILQPGSYTLSVDISAAAFGGFAGGQAGSTCFANFNFALGPTPTPTPPPGVNISGNISDCSNPVPGPVSNVTLTLSGSGSGSTQSDGSGNYTFSSLAPGGSYTVTPSKAGRTPGSPGINTVDVIATQRHFLALGTPLSGCRLTAADVNGDSTVNTVDVLAIERFFLSRTFGTANVGNYQFSPASRTYPAVGSNQTNQNFATLIFGDVAAPFVAP